VLGLYRGELLRRLAAQCVSLPTQTRAEDVRSPCRGPNRPASRVKVGGGGEGEPFSTGSLFFLAAYEPYAVPRMEGQSGCLPGKATPSLSRGNGPRCPAVQL
jgi:hypothetical protein